MTLTFIAIVKTTFILEKVVIEYVWRTHMYAQLTHVLSKHADAT